MSHYVCTGGCGGVSDDPQGTCQAGECPDHGQPLKECNCVDSNHAEVMKQAGDSEAT